MNKSLATSTLSHGARFYLLTFGICIAAAAAADDPSAELASFQIADGFEANLFASEKDGVVKPIQMRFDPRGRLWVIGSTVYPQIQPGQSPTDKVLILEDTDGDGRCDKTTIFADGLMIPTGIELADGGAYIGHGPELLFLKDTNGDDRADERRIVMRGFGTGDNHQNINSFLFGPGGELWMCQGLHIHSNVETPWGIVRLHQAGIWRLRPRLMKLEGFYGSEHEPQNPWGFVFTDWGEPIELAGNNSSPIYPVPGLVSNHRNLAPSLIWRNGNGRKVSGGDIAGTKHFPDHWQGALILGGYINNAIWTVKILEDGAGFVLEDLPPLIKSSSRSFRPVDVKFGPDGALYVCDWSNPIIGHYQASFRHPDRDKTHGRIWRITAKGRPLTKPPLLADASIDELLEQLKSSDRWTRRFAKRVLADRSKEQVRPGLAAWIEQPGLTEHHLVEALGVYQSHEEINAELLIRVCRAKDPNARAYAAGVGGRWADRLPDPLALLRPLVADENARVRLHAVISCTYVPKPEAMEVAAVAADFSTDRFLSYALNQAVFALKPHWLPALNTGKLDLENKPSRLGMLVRADATTDTLQAVRDLARNTPRDAGLRESYWTLLAENGNADDLAAILQLPDKTLQARLLPELASAAAVRRIRPAGDLSALLRPLIENRDPELRAGAFKLAGIWKVQTFRTDAETIASKADADVRVRRSAIEAVAAFGNASALLSRLASDSSLSVRSAAIVALAKFDAALAAQKAADWFAVPAGLNGRHADAKTLEETEAIEVLTAFLQRPEAANTLASRLAEKPPGKRIAETGLTLMNASGRRHEALARVLTEAAGFSTNNKNLTPAEMTAFVAEVRSRADAKRGAEIYRRQELGCVACHKIQGEGGSIGPELSALGTAQPIDFIVGAILDPQKEIKEGFTSISITTRDGEEYQGYQIRESAEEIVLRDALQNQDIRIGRDKIKDRRQNGSVMPAGLADTLTRPEFRDLVRYLSELGALK